MGMGMRRAYLFVFGVNGKVAGWEEGEEGFTNAIPSDLHFYLMFLSAFPMLPDALNTFCSKRLHIYLVINSRD